MSAVLVMYCDQSKILLKCEILREFASPEERLILNQPYRLLNLPINKTFSP